MIVAIHQPQYFPWLGLIDKISKCDTFIFLDDVQFQRGGFQSRTTYSTDQGSKYLILPVKAQNHIENEIKISDITFVGEQSRILRKHFETLRHRYMRSPGWKDVEEKMVHFFREVKYESPCDLLIASTLFTMELLEVKKNIVKSSEINTKGKKDELVLDLVKSVGGNVYLSGRGAKAYMNDDIFHAAGVDVKYQEFSHPKYNQKIEGSFIEGCMGLEMYLDDPELASKYF